MAMIRGVLVAVILAVPLLAGAKGVAQTAMGRFILPCDRAGAMEAVYACALSKAVEAGVVSSSVVQACQDDLGSAPLGKPNQELWVCAGLRQFGQQMPDDEWRSETERDCEARSRRATHRYTGQRNQCIVDAIIEQRRVPDAVVNTCRSQPGIQKNHRLQSHRLLNCLYSSFREKADAIATHSAGGSPASVKDRKQAPGKNPGLPASWAERVQVGQPSTSSRQQDEAEYPLERIHAGNKNYCESTNRGGTWVYDCACVLGEVDRHLAEGQLSRKTIAHHEFNWTPCIDRALSADKFVASIFTPTSEQMMRGLGIDVGAAKACQHRAIAHDIPLESLTSWDYVKSEIKRLCLPQNRR